MFKKNCWEIKNCGRAPGGEKVKELGVCAAATDTAVSGLNSGKNGGRICWAIVGTLCGGKRQGTFAEKKVTCITCDVYKLVKQEEGNLFKMLKPGQKYEHIDKKDIEK